MTPRSPLILDSIIASLDAWVMPHVEDEFAISILKTVSNLLRHVQTRIEHEPRLLYDAMIDLAAVLGDLRGRIAAHPSLASIDSDGLLQDADLPDGAAILLPERLEAAQTDQLTRLDTLIGRLAATREDHADDGAYREMRALIRAYLARQLARDEQLITPAFIGGRR